MAYMTKAKTEVGVKPAPVIASLSSRGPNPIQPIILKVHSLFHYGISTFSYSLMC